MFLPRSVEEPGFIPVLLSGQIIPLGLKPWLSGIIKAIVTWGLHRLLLLVVCALSLVACGATHRLSVHVGNATFAVTIPDGELAVSDADVTNYVQRGATAIITYFGKFPMDRANINIRAVNGRKVRFGRTMPENGGTIMMLIGRDAPVDALNDDWTLTHEMSHLAFPATKEDDTDWLGEGMATYVEPIARAQAGYLTPEYVWNQFVDDMPRGEPTPGDGGLDGGQGIGRIYWGGALFCLVADVQIRKETKNKKGLQDAFRAIMNDKGTMEYSWPIKMIFKEGDQATGTHVLEDLYASWKDKPVEVDLPKLWQEMGIEKKGSSVVFHDDAAEAEARKGITAGH